MCHPLPVRLRFRIDGLVAFDMSAEAQAHGGEHLVAEVCSCRERNRVNSAVVSTLAGTASSIAASTVQRPSPESWTKPEKSFNCGSFASAAAPRSSSHDEMTLPRRQTSAISGMFSVNRSPSGRSFESLLRRMSKPSA
jgi:hypothetical protein